MSHWVNATGWYQTNDSTALGMPEQLSALLEGEWFDGHNSLSVRLLAPNQYQVTKLSTNDQETDSDYCYQDQDIYLRGNLCTSSVNTVRYRQWFQCQEHAWQPVASQFLGFTFTEEQ
ncbi:MAG: hypothetical protein Q4G44_07395 [Alcaligenaceae bacterium]|nr:hypothetical protein [Alcaligenaceae bacterium]